MLQNKINHAKHSFVNKGIFAHKNIQIYATFKKVVF